MSLFDDITFKEGPYYNEVIYSTVKEPEKPLSQQERDHYFQEFFTQFFKSYCFKLSSDKARLLPRTILAENCWEEGRLSGPQLGHAWELFNKVLDRFDKGAYQEDNIGIDNFFSGFAIVFLERHILDEKRRMYLSSENGRVQKRIRDLQKVIKEESIDVKVENGEKISTKQKELYLEFIKLVDQSYAKELQERAVGGKVKNNESTLQNFVDKSVESVVFEDSNYLKLDISKFVSEEISSLFDEKLRCASIECQRYIVLRYVFEITKKDLEIEFDGKDGRLSLNKVDYEYRKIVKDLRDAKKSL